MSRVDRTSGAKRVMTYAELAARIGRSTRTKRTGVVGVDGPAGSGKTSFARRLAVRLDAPIVHLDDICPGWKGITEAASRLVEWVLVPLAAGEVARYRRYDWDRAQYEEWHSVPQAPWLIVEGVTSGSAAVARYLSFLIWVTAPLEVRIARGIARDGESYRSRWEAWSQEEEKVFSSEGTRELADISVDGAPTLPHDPEREFVVLSETGGSESPTTEQLLPQRSQGLA